jgi:hypothetical protein
MILDSDLTVDWVGVGVYLDGKAMDTRFGEAY